MNFNERRKQIEIDVDSILSEIDMRYIVEFYKIQNLLDYADHDEALDRIGKKRCKEHFDLVEAE